MYTIDRQPITILKRIAITLLFCIVMSVMISGTAIAEQRFPPPEFTTDYVMPEVSGEKPYTTLTDWAIVCLYAIALSAATWFSIVQRSRRALFVTAIVSVAIFGFWRAGCVCAVGSLQNVAMAIADRSYAIPLTVLTIFTLPLVFSLFVGRTFCSSVCPLGALQELVLLRPVKVPAWLNHSLGMFRYVYLGLAVMLASTGTAMVICQYDPFVGFFRLSGPVSMLVTGALLLLIGLFVGRPYCRYICPYGALLGIAARVAKKTPSVTPSDCISCRLCEDACPYGAIQHPTVTPLTLERHKGRNTLVCMLLVTPVLILIGGYFGHLTAVPLSQLHPTVRIAEMVLMEEMDLLELPTDEAEAYEKTGEENVLLYAEAAAIQTRLKKAGIWFGIFVGLAFGLKLISLSIRRKRTDYTIDPVACFSCGRCYMSCPKERERLGLIMNIEPIADERVTTNN